MKKIFCLILSLLLVITFTFTAFASESIMGTEIAEKGDKVVVSVAVDGAGYYGFQGKFVYDNTLLALGSVKTGLEYWSCYFKDDKFVLYDNSLYNPVNGNYSVFYAEFLVLETAEKKSIKVEITDFIATDGKQDIPLSDLVHTINVKQDIVSSETVKPSSNADLIALSVADYPFTNVVDNNFYIGTINNSVTSLNITAIPSDAKSTVSISGNELNVGDNTVTVTVTAEDGTKKEYYIFVTRSAKTSDTPSNSVSGDNTSMDAGINGDTSSKSDGNVDGETDSKPNKNESDNVTSKPNGAVDNNVSSQSNESEISGNSDKGVENESDLTNSSNTVGIFGSTITSVPEDTEEFMAEQDSYEITEPNYNFENSNKNLSDTAVAIIVISAILVISAIAAVIIMIFIRKSKANK